MADNATADDPGSTAALHDATAKPKRLKPTKALPTERIAFHKQLDMLRAFAVAYTTTQKAVTNAEVADIVKMAATTVPHANAFFSETGLLLRQDGAYIPSEDVMRFHRAHEWNPENAAHKLAPTLRMTWFANTLIPKLAFRGSIDEREAISLLAEAAGAAPEFKGALDVLLQYLAVSGLIDRDGTTIRKTVAGIPADARTEPPPMPIATPSPVAVPQPIVQVERTTEQHLLDILDPDAMSDDEQTAVWTLLKYLKKKGRG
jgi:hypothetical protein